jgi:transcriptional regulator with XRE-family HTH domain
VSSFQRAREALGLRLRELRRDAHLTGRQLADARDWHPSKISKIEGGKQTPSEADLESWARACGQPKLIPELVASLRTLETHYVEWRRMFRAGMAAKQQAVAELEAETAFIRNFETVVIPGLLQTPEYARFRLAEGIEYDEAPDDLDEAVAARMHRQQVLYRTGKKFHFVIAESALRIRLCPPEVMAGQLDRLVTLSTMPALRFGVIPFDVTYPAAPMHGFWIFDERLVTVENRTAELSITQPSEVEGYLRIFGRLAEVASYGSSARTVITRVLADLVASTSDAAHEDA